MSNKSLLIISSLPADACLRQAGRRKGSAFVFTVSNMGLVAKTTFMGKYLV